MYEVDWTANVLVSWLTVAELLSPVCSMSDTFCGVAPAPSSACVTFALLLAPLWLTSESPPESEPVWSKTAPLPVFDSFTVLVDWAQAGAAINNETTVAAHHSNFLIHSLHIGV